MIRKLLIANRGEVACRIIRTCREMGIFSVAVYSDADARALHVERADEAVYIGGSSAPDSYLNIEKLIEAAKGTGVDAVHPGYGFLAENARFAQAVIDAGLIYVGPPPSAIEAMGSKRGAKRLLKGTPVVPGYLGDDQTDERLIAEAIQIGFPVMIKASAGGGGKGMRQVDAGHDMPAALEAARREAKQAFGDETLLLEKVVSRPRHIEVQIFGDQHGNVIALGERECTIQRRHQKIIEETPSTMLTPDLRARMFEAAANIGTQLGYTSAGTVEFLVDDQNNFYFMEMNTRLQVEHPITEEATGFDLVRWQIMVAEGYPLPDMDVYPAGHAIEARIYAEDPANEFLPSTGEILRWREPTEVRVDSGIRTGDAVSVYYDPMLAKIVAYGEHRDGAIRRLDHALAQLQLLGLRNNVALLRRVLTHPDHMAGNITTTFIADHPELLRDDDAPSPAALAAAALARSGHDGRVPPERPNPDVHPTGMASAMQAYWRNNAYRPIRERFRFAGVVYDVLLTPEKTDAYLAHIGEQTYNVLVWSREGEGRAWDITLSLDNHRQTIAVAVAGDTWWVHAGGRCAALVWESPLPQGSRSPEAEGSLHAPMPGQVRAVNVEVGQEVSAGDVLMILEAMKMEHRIKAPYAGRVAAIHYRAGQSVPVDAVLLELHSLSDTIKDS